MSKILFASLLLSLNGCVPKPVSNLETAVQSPSEGISNSTVAYCNLVAFQDRTLDQIGSYKGSIDIDWGSNEFMGVELNPELSRFFDLNLRMYQAGVLNSDLIDSYGNFSFSGIVPSMGKSFCTYVRVLSHRAVELNLNPRGNPGLNALNQYNFACGQK